MNTDVTALILDADHPAKGSLFHAGSHAKARMSSERLRTSAIVFGYPKTMRAGRGADLVSRDLDLGAGQNGVAHDVFRPAKPTENACIETFGSRFRQARLDAHWFLTLAEYHKQMEAWRRFYDEDRPHGAIGDSAPLALTDHAGASGQRA